MSDKYVYLYQTEELYNQMTTDYGDGTRSLYRAKEYIEGAFSETTYSVNVAVMNERPDPPTERWKDVDGDVPCSDNFTGHWDRLNDWFGDWLYCNDYQTGHDDHEDVSLLLSNIKTATNGGNSDPTHCHSQTGYLIADLPSSYTSAGYGDEFNAMETILHELGHSFANETGTANEHNLGRTDSVSSSNTDITRTSLLKLDVGESNDSNACGDPHYVTDGDVRYENKWSDCCTDYWN